MALIPGDPFEMVARRLVISYKPRIASYDRRIKLTVGHQIQTSAQKLNCLILAESQDNCLNGRLTQEIVLIGIEFDE